MKTNTTNLMRELKNDPYSIKKLQNRILEIALYFDSFCKKHDIKYFLMGGSALGAVRHGGFIPWDDDLDVFMDRENYLKLIKLSNKIDKRRFYFQKQQTYEQPYYFSKLRMNGTTFIDNNLKKERKIHQGIFIDIMCLYNIPKNILLQKVQYYEAALLKARAVQRYGYNTNSKIKRVQLLISRILVNGIIEILLYKHICHYKKTGYVGHLFGRAKFNNSIYKSEWFTEQQYVPFENTTLPVSNGVREYLRERYGEEYMEMPSEETKQQYKSHATLWSVDTGYKDYINEKL